MFQGGPKILEGVREPPGRELHVVHREDALAGRWPPDLLESARRTLEAGHGLLVVGHTDAVGPHPLNRSLGLQYAADAARSLARRLEAGLERFGCASAGEDQDRPPGVTLHVWVPPAGVRPTGYRTAILEPLPGIPNRGALWAAWKGMPKLTLLAHGIGPRSRLWEIDGRGAGQMRLPLPARARVVGVGNGFSTGGGDHETRTTELETPAELEELALALTAVESGWMRLRAKLPPGFRDPIVWAGGIPYPAVPDPKGETEVAVARVGRACAAYLQAVGPEGQVAHGPRLEFPPPVEALPDWSAVLVWHGEDVDLDLHAWQGRRHTHPLNPDPRYSDAAVPEVRLLFDGDDRQPASALAGWSPADVTLEVRCYSDLSREGAVARLYLVENPDDPVARRLRIFGPRTLSEQPTQMRWAAVQRGERSQPSIHDGGDTDGPH